MAAVQLVAAIRHQHEKREARGATRKIVDEITRGGIRPLQVLDDEQERAIVTERTQEHDDKLEEAHRALASVVVRGPLRTRPPSVERAGPGRRPQIPTTARTLYRSERASRLPAASSSGR